MTKLGFPFNAPNGLNLNGKITLENYLHEIRTFVFAQYCRSQQTDHCQIRNLEKEFYLFSDLPGRLRFAESRRHRNGPRAAHEDDSGRKQSPRNSSRQDSPDRDSHR